MDLEEELEDVPEGDPVGIEDELDRLGVPTRLVLSRVVALATGPPNPDRDDSLAVTHQLLRDPAATSGEDRGLCVSLIDLPFLRSWRGRDPRRSAARSPRSRKPQAEHKQCAGTSYIESITSPAVLRFNARISRPPEAKNGSGAVLAVPKTIGTKLRDMPKVEGTIEGHPFRAALEPNPDGGLWLRVNKAMLRGADADAGDSVQLAVLGPEPDPDPPADLRAAFDESPEAEPVWDELTTMGRQDWVRWIEEAKKPETRARRVKRTVEQLSEGKRRACCVNVYQYMLDRVEEDEQGSERTG